MSDHRPAEPTGPRRPDASLARLSQRLGDPSAAVLQAVFSRWDEVVGGPLAIHARPVSLVGGVLVVAVDDPAWGNELRYLASSVLARLEEVVGPGAATRVEVRVRPLSARRQGPPVVK